VSRRIPSAVRVSPAPGGEIPGDAAGSQPDLPAHLRQDLTGFDQARQASLGSGTQVNYFGEDRLRAEAVVSIAPRLPGSLPQIWNVQQRNPAFIGRDTALVELRDQLLAGGTAVARALHGMGGVGKTQLAVEYAYLFSGTYDLVWWIAAERTELIAAQLADLGVKAGVAVDSAEIPAAVSALYSDLRRRDSWLLIFDNAEDPRALQQWLPGGSGHVLITSRNPNWGEIAAPVNVAVFASEESVTLLRRRVPSISAADAGHIAVELGNFPLALGRFTLRKRTRPGTGRGPRYRS